MSCDGNQDIFCEREGSLPCSCFWLQKERAIRNVDEQMCFGSFIITSFLDLLMLSRRGHIPYFRFLSNNLCEIAQADDRVSIHQSTNISWYYTEHVTIHNGISSALRELKSCKGPCSGWRNYMRCVLSPKLRLWSPSFQTVLHGNPRS